MEIKFYGVRGSTPCSGTHIQRYGGNTSCVVLVAQGCEPLILDLGTGLRVWGTEIPPDIPFQGHALVTHLHWDHVQGLPFFTPLHRPDSVLKVYGPAEEKSFEDNVRGFMQPPYFPVELEGLSGTVLFENFGQEEKQIGQAIVTSRHVPHVGLTNGYRIRLGESVVTYISDHQQPDDGTMSIEPGVRELCQGADVLIHDAQYTQEEFSQKSTWGHCTIEYALAVAAECQVKHLVLFHHDPSHDDTFLDALLEKARNHEFAQGITITAAYEGLSLTL